MRRNKNRKSSSRSVSFYNNRSFQPLKFNLLLFRSLQHSGSCFVMMQFLASSLTHVWSIAAPSYYRQGSTFQTILVTKKHPRQREAGSRRNFLGLLTNYIVTVAAGKVSRKMALGSADLSPLILPDSPVETLFLLGPITTHICWLRYLMTSPL